MTQAWYWCVLLFQMVMGNVDKCASCFGEMKNCLFFHGAGSEVEEPNLINSYEVYWGNQLFDNLPCCKSIQFARFDTHNTPWINETLQQKYCSAMLRIDDDVTDPSEKTVDDMIIVTHSMASLVLSLAIDSGKCNLGNSTKWVSLQSPMKGSPAADSQTKVCELAESESRITKYVASSVTKVLSWIGVCPSVDSLSHFYQQGGKHALQLGLDAYYEKAQNAFRNRVDAVMCGTSATGLYTSYSATFKSVSKYIDFNDTLNDGMVDVDSCMGTLDSSLFHNTFRSRFYTAAINHADGTFRNGDGTFGEDRQPLKWLKCLF